MSKTFRTWDVDQGWLLPPSVHEFVPAGHLAHFVRDTVREGLDLSAVVGAYEVDRGQPPYDPGMMVALLLYGYSRGVYSSRRLALACEERVDFMAVTGLNRPDFRTISEFRRRHLSALSGLFVQVLRLCQVAGLVKLGHVAVDGTKLKANASRHKAMSYGRLKTSEPKLAAEVAAWLDEAEAADRAEDAEHGAELRGDETPDWMADKQRRLERIRQAKAQLEAEAASDPADLDPEGPGPSSGTNRPLMAAMAKKLKRGGRKSRYRLRKQTVEPVFGQIKQARGFRQFHLRGLEKVRAEWSLICTAHNLLKLAGAR
jgi:transposase